MKIEARNIFKRYTKNYIIRDFSYEFQSQKKYGIKGANGSGKSTLMQMLSGYLSPSKGEIIYTDKSGIVQKRNDVFRYVSYVAPYIHLDDELTPEENFDHLRNFKNFSVANIQALLELANLEGNREKTLRHFSDGMRQRFGIVLALTSDADLVLLDEPTSFLDQKSKAWFLNLIEQYCDAKTLIIASNEPDDFKSVEEIIIISNPE